MSYKFFQNKSCEYFPCHKGVDEENFNCLFCFCPLYNLDCGGNYKITKINNKTKVVKDCLYCLFPHKKENYEKILEKLK